MRAIKHAFKDKSGVYYFRLTLPKWMLRRDNNSKKSIYLSLKTYDPTVANFRAKALWVEAQKAMQLESKNNTTIHSDIQRRLKQYRDYIADAPDYEQEAVLWGTPDFERILDYNEGELRELANLGLIDELEEDFSNLSTLSSKAAEIRAKINRERIELIAEQAILNSRISFKEQQSKSPAALHSESSQPRTSLQEILDEYLRRNDTGEVQWSPKNRDKEESHFSFLIEVVGNIPVQDFGKDHLRKFLEKLKNRSRIRAGKPVPISAKTRNEYIATCKRVFNFAKPVYEDVKTNYFDDKAILFKSVENERVPFSREELRKLFSHSVFTEGNFSHPYQYWIPLLALYTGCRGNELAQLHVKDFVVSQEIPCISLNSNTADKRLKNVGSIRLVPLHPKLIDLGFQKFVELHKTKPVRWKDENGYYRLFKGLSLDKKNGGYQKNLSRWFNGTYDRKLKQYKGFKYEAGVETNDTQRKDFHSFRHTCSTALENAGVPTNIGFKITGHTLRVSEKVISVRGRTLSARTRYQSNV